MLGSSCRRGVGMCRWGEAWVGVVCIDVANIYSGSMRTDHVVLMCQSRCHAKKSLQVLIV